MLVALFTNFSKFPNFPKLSFLMRLFCPLGVSPQAEGLHTFPLIIKRFSLIICTVENKFLHLQPVSTSYTGRRLRKRIIGEGAVMVSRRSDNVERLTF